MAGHSEVYAVALPDASWPSSGPEFVLTGFGPGLFAPGSPDVGENMLVEGFGPVVFAPDSPDVGEELTLNGFGPTLTINP
jgi:hypothetical protein